MEVLHPRCAGLDVHNKTVVACVRLTEGDAIRHEVRTFATSHRGLLALADWLTAANVTHVAMEATGTYWKPVWQVLDGLFTLTLGNPGHIRNVPGRKTDVNDAHWLADLHAHGLIHASFVPPEEIQELRECMRERRQLIRERGQHVQRVEKILQSAGIKLGTVLTNLMGKSGRAILAALADGRDRSPEELADLAQGTARKKRSALIEVLQNRLKSHQQELVRMHLALIDAVDAAIERVEDFVGKASAPLRMKAKLLATMPGMSESVALEVLGEIGVDMTRFPSAGHLVSWAGLCPRNDESAGKRRSTRVRRSGTWIKPVLVQAAWAAVRTKGSYLRALFLRLKSRRGAKKAIVAVAASMLTAIWHMLHSDVPYNELGGDWFDNLDRERAVGRHVARLRKLGYTVELTEVEAA